MLSQMPFPPSGNVNDAYFYVEAPWIKDLSKYNMNVDESMYMDMINIMVNMYFPWEE